MMSTGAARAGSRRIMRTLLVVLCLFVSASVSVAAPDADPRRWIPGDLHMHVSPPDDPNDVAMSAAEIARAAKAQGMEFVVLTPHMRAWTGAARRRFAARWRTLADDARAETGVTLIPGAELGMPGLGHFSISGIDLAALVGDDLLAAARTAGAFIVVNHPFAVPTGIPGIEVSRADLSYQPGSHGATGWDDFDGVEVWNLPLSLANLVSRPGGQGKSGEDRAFEAADQRARTERRRVAVTGGTDNHRHAVMATTWVLALDASEASIISALRDGAVCVGGPEAGELRAHGDGDAADHWARIGDSVHAAKRVELRWTGTAELFVDGADQGEHDGGAKLDVDGAVHTFRIVVGASRSGFVYANLDP
jgi:hypothetical protein